MIGFVYGTSGELIKIAPVMRRLSALGVDYISVSTAQQATQLPETLAEFGLGPPDFALGDGAKGRDLKAHRDVPPWFATVVSRFVRQRSRLRAQLVRGPGRPLLMVHGDTMTTAIGALMGRALGVETAHLEAGLRSWDLRNPFPEELTRRVATRLARLHFAPGKVPVANIGTGRGVVVDTVRNTVVDSLRLAASDRPPRTPVPEAYGLVSVHRSELVDSRARLTALVDALFEHSRRTPLVFVNHPVTEGRLRDFSLLDRFDDRLVGVAKQPYFEFARLLGRSHFVITDSGGLQEECAALGHPCFVHRLVTERDDGLGESVVLSEGDLAKLTDFLADLDHYRRPPLPSDQSPTDIVVDYLLREGYGVPRTTSP